MQNYCTTQRINVTFPHTKQNLKTLQTWTDIKWKGLCVCCETYSVNPREMTSVSCMRRRDLRERLVSARLLFTKPSSWTARDWTRRWRTALCHRDIPRQAHITHTRTAHNHRASSRSGYEKRRPSRTASIPTKTDTSLWQRNTSVTYQLDNGTRFLLALMWLCTIEREARGSMALGQQWWHWGRQYQWSPERAHSDPEAQSARRPPATAHPETTDSAENTGGRQRPAGKQTQLSTITLRLKINLIIGSSYQHCLAAILGFFTVRTTRQDLGLWISEF